MSASPRKPGGTGPSGAGLPTLDDSERKVMMQLQEGLLLDYAERLEKYRRDRYAVHLHLSRLQPQNRREPQVQAAVQVFEPLVENNRAQVFSLHSGDVIAVFPGRVRDEIEADLIRIRFLFTDDPLLDEEGGRGDSLVTWYEMMRDYPAFLALAQRFFSASREERAARVEAAPAPVMHVFGRPKPRRLAPLSAGMLGRLEEALARTDLANLVRHQAVCAVVGRSTPQPMYSEIYVSISDLREIFVPDVDIVSDPWLFQHLSETLDRRVLSLVNAGRDNTLAGGYSININVKTILSQAFLDFDDGIAGGQRGSIVLEIQLYDVFADVGAYLFARDFARERGYRICIDGVTAATLCLIDRARLSADLVKLVWSDEVTAARAAGEAHPLVRAVARAGRKRMILSRIETPEAMRTGQDLGISMFQGHAIDRMLKDLHP